MTIAAPPGARAGAVVMPFMGMEPEVQIQFTRMTALIRGAAWLVLLTAGAAVAGFLLSRAARRSHETAARIALGATRGRLVSQIAADALVIAAGGGSLGALVAYWTRTALPALLYVEDAARLQHASDLAGMFGSAAACSGIVLACALAPLAELRRVGTMTVLRRSENPAVTAASWLRSALAVAQMAICVVLALGTAVLLQGFRDALRTARGDHLGDPVIAIVEAAARYAKPEEGRAYFARLEREAFAIPGVASVAWTGTLPGGRTPELTVRLELPRTSARDITMPAVTPEGKTLLAYDLVQGRAFGGQDSPSSCRVALVNEAAVEEVFGGHALGQSIDDAAGRRTDIIGVIRPKPPAKQETAPRLFFYERQSPGNGARAATERFVLPVGPPAVDTDVEVNVVSSGAFAATGALLIAGRESSVDAADCEFAIINREAEQLYFGGHAVGGAVIDVEGRRASIVGVVDDGALRVLQRRPQPMVYFPFAQRYQPRMTLIAGTQRATPELVAALDRRLHAVAGGFSPPIVMTLDDYLSKTSLGPERIAMVLVAVSAATSLALSVLGAYGVMSDAVRQRKREIALRIALGARAGTIIGGVLRDGLRIAGAGGVAGVAAGWMLVRLADHANPGLTRPALWMWLTCPAALLVIVVVASVLPARWALAVNPLTITREN